MILPPAFDLWLDVKDSEQLADLYRRVCFEKATIERLCESLSVPLPPLFHED